MNTPSTNNYNRPSRRSSRAPLAKWLDGFVDKACFACAPSTYAVGSHVDESYMSYDEDDDSLFLETRQDRKGAYPEFISSSRPRQGRARDDASVLFRDVDESIQWLVENNSFQQQQRPGLQKSRPLRSPISSDATATTVQTGSSSRSSISAVRCGNEQKSFLKSPAAVASSRGSRLSHHERSNSSGVKYATRMDSPFSSAARTIQHANRIDSPTSDHEAEKCPREVLVPKNWSRDNALRRISSETLPKALPFKPVQ